MRINIHCPVHPHRQIKGNGYKNNDQVAVNQIFISRCDVPQMMPVIQIIHVKHQNIIEKQNDNQSVDDIFKIGQKVYHATFGKGQIKGLEGHGEKMKITVIFNDEGITKKLMREFANLTPLEE